MNMLITVGSGFWMAFRIRSPEVENKPDATPDVEAVEDKPKDEETQDSKPTTLQEGTSHLFS